ncbi:MAG: molybdopterin oxidoreductase family protein [Planctomycetota bacterium]|nr:molybdopterin oxidoreductase family protein [Planctomycetota bacterium]
MPEIHKTVCSHDCPDACSVLVTVDGPPGDRRALSFRGDPDHPFTRGFLCGKVANYEEMVYAGDRLLRPLRRVGPKGRGDFEPLSWEEALRTIAGRLVEAKERHGGESILQYTYAGTMGLVHRFCGEALFHRLGATRLRQNICYYGADEGYRLVVGSGYGLDPEDVVHSDLVVVWGCNVVTTQVHLVPFIDEAKKRGATLVVIDPYRNRTARRADEWISLQPGTDTALALAMMHVIERDGLLERDFLERRTLGYDRLSEVLSRYSPEKAAAITGVDSGTIVGLAHRFAAARAPVVKVGIGLGRSSHGAAAMRSICCLAGTVGAYEKLGGGVLYDTGCEFKFQLDGLTRPDWRTEESREVNMTDLGPALTRWQDPPLSVLYVHGSNPLATAPLQDVVRQGLEREDLFTVVHERFLTDTARYADIVLPAVTFPESSDLYKSYGHLYLEYARKVIDPPGECRSNLEVMQALGKALGYDDPWFDRSVEDFVVEIIESSRHPNFDTIDLDRLLRGETLRLNLPRRRSGFAERFLTPSGRLEFASRELEDRGLPAVVDYQGDPFHSEPQKYPLRLITPPAHAFLNASFGSLERARLREGGEPRVLVHPDDARDIRSGDVVELAGAHGSLHIVARVTEDTRPGTVVAEGSWWPLHGRDGKGINTLTSNRLTDLGGGATFHDNRVALGRP